MYTPFRKTLKSLWRQFKRCTEIYPPLYYDRLMAWSPEGQQNISQEAWELFEKANALDEEEAWEEWDGDPAAGFYGRFYGDPAGLDEFRQLAESAYLAVCEMDSTLGEGRGYCGWLNMLYDIAFVYPTPLLRCDLTQWGFDNLGTEDEFDERAAKWSRKQQRYPKHPCHWSLIHNLFVSSMTAIQLTLDSGSALVVTSAQLDDFPLKILKRTGPSDGEDTAIRPTEPITADAQHQSSSPGSSNAAYIFRCDGELWYFRFPGDEPPEGKPLPDEKGFQHYAKVIAAYPKPIDALEIDPPKAERSDVIGSWVKEKDQDPPVRDVENKQGRSEYREKKAAIKQFQEELAQTLQALEERLSAAEATGNQELADDLRYSIEQTKKLGREEILQIEKPGKTGKPPPEEVARHRIRIAMYRCRKTLHEANMQRLAQHLRDYVPPSGTSWTYTGKIDWQLQ
mgnify:FL=1